MRNPPPVAERPKCANCNKPLKPHATHTQVRENSGFQWKRIKVDWNGSYHCYGFFCALRCCERFANSAYAAGYRIKR